MTLIPQGKTKHQVIFSRKIFRQLRSTQLPQADCEAALQGANDCHYSLLWSRHAALVKRKATIQQWSLETIKRIGLKITYFFLNKFAFVTFQTRVTHQMIAR